MSLLLALIGSAPAEPDPIFSQYLLVDEDWDEDDAVTIVQVTTDDVIQAAFETDDGQQDEAEQFGFTLQPDTLDWLQATEVADDSEEGEDDNRSFTFEDAVVPLAFDLFSPTSYDTEQDTDDDQDPLIFWFDFDYINPEPPVTTTTPVVGFIGNTGTLMSR